MYICCLGLPTLLKASKLSKSKRVIDESALGSVKSPNINTNTKVPLPGSELSKI